MAKQRVGSMRWVVESTPDNVSRSNEFVAEAIMIAFRRLHNANLALAFYDENDVRQRTVTFEKLGTPMSAEMQRLMEFEFGTDDDPEEAASA
jgi:hypothetical protein